MTMTIREAQEDFRLAKSDPSLDIRFALMEIAIKKDPNAVFRNHSYYDALLLSMAMINHADESFYMFIGDGAEVFIEQMKDEFRAMLTRFKTGEGGRREARIIILSTEKNEFSLFKELAVEFKNLFAFLSIPIKREDAKGYRHFTITDGKMYRLEEPHEPVGNDTLADTIRAEVAFNNKYVVKYLEEVFESYWNAKQVA